MAEKKKLGDLLKEAGLIDESQLQAALTHQRNWGGKLGAVLVEMGFVRETDLVKVISGTLRIPYANLFEPEIPESIVKLIKPDVAKKYGIMPVKKDGGALMVALADPLDIKTIDEIQFITGLVIKPSLAMETEIRDAIRKYYDHEPITHRDSSSLLDHFKSSFKEGEIVQEREDKTAGVAWKPPAQPERTAPRGEPVPDRLLLDALVGLLLEKKVITREELLAMIEQKKMGL